MANDKKPVKKQDEEEEEAGSAVAVIVFLIAVAVGVVLYLKQHGFIGAKYSACGCKSVWEPVCIEIENEAVEGISEEEKKRMPPYTSMTLPNICEAECMYFGEEYANHYEGVCAVPEFTKKDEMDKCLYLNCEKNEAFDGSMCLHGKTYPDACFMQCEADTNPEKDYGDLAQAVVGKCTDPCKNNDCPDDTECVHDAGKCFEGKDCKMYKCGKKECSCKEPKVDGPTDWWKPVCSKGRSFSNSCYAECEGAKEWTEGECKTHDTWRTEFGVFPFPNPNERETHMEEMKAKEEGMQLKFKEHNDKFAPMRERELKKRPKESPGVQKQAPQGGPGGQGGQQGGQPGQRPGQRRPGMRGPPQGAAAPQGQGQEAPKKPEKKWKLGGGAKKPVDEETVVL